VGDLAMAKPNPKPDDGAKEQAAAKPASPETAPPAHQRPRTLAEALMQQSQLTGEKMRQEGGVQRQRLIPSLDAKATPFGEYDAEFIAIVQQHWDDLLIKQNFARDRTGKVVVEFRLNFDGRISDMRVVENNVDDLLSYLCQRAILDPAPFPKWPADMRRVIGADYRIVTFTFFYD